MSAALFSLSANPRKTTTVRNLGQVDIAELRAAVLAIPEAVWDAENANKPNKFEVLDETRHIVFRFIDSPRDWRRSHDRAAWPQWRGVLEPVLAQAVRGYGYARGVFPRVMFARLPPGGVIHPHTLSYLGPSESAVKTCRGAFKVSDFVRRTFRGVRRTFRGGQIVHIGLDA